MAPIEENKAGEEQVEDTPIIKELKVIDDKYLELEREYEREVAKLEALYTEKQRPLLEERATVLQAGESDQTGTPAVADFWAKALANHPALEDAIEEYDMPVLAFIKDIKKENLDASDSSKGFKLTFEFAENPFFENATLEKEYITEEDSPYTGDINVVEVKSTKVDWKPGKDVTVELVKKKVKGGGAKKAKQAKEKQEPRPSFFRGFFRNLKPDMDLPDDINLDLDEEDEDMDDENLMQMVMENDHEMGSAIRDNIIPFAVRWYTGEAAPEDDSFDEDEEEESEDDEDEESSEEDESPKGKKGAKAKVKGGDKKKGARTGSADEEGKKEECKQQ
eukprot:TRINITY_DN56004_c0_g1_i1.p1 TRINITY_DN56004_c0_g1~~TRINITY_DN56004_c0_g1_i1.p1  ORF type:complete len:335 (-),score=143.67 TRINITY_DN56004_c0_g1_i1:237-1241(-)